MPRISSTAALITLALVLALLPRGWTAWVRGVVQPIAWLQQGASIGTRSGQRAIRSAAGRAPTAEQHREMAARNQELARQLGHQSVRIQSLMALVDDLTGLRGQLDDASTRVIIASIIGYDALPRRDALMLNVGARRGVAAGDWVAAGRSRGENEPAASGRTLLSGQWLIGVVEEVHPFTCRVQLATDRYFRPQEVRVAAVGADGSLTLGGRPSLLEGLGSGRMLIRHAVADYRASGHLLILVSAGARLPGTMAIGRIVSSRAVADAPKHFDLTAEPIGDVRQLGRVFVISTRR